VWFIKVPGDLGSNASLRVAVFPYPKRSKETYIEVKDKLNRNRESKIEGGRNVANSMNAKTLCNATYQTALLGLMIGSLRMLLSTHFIGGIGFSSCSNTRTMATGVFGSSSATIESLPRGIDDWVVVSWPGPMVAARTIISGPGKSLKGRED
jgi:hypothetical protein